MSTPIRTSRATVLLLNLVIVHWLGAFAGWSSAGAEPVAAGQTHQPGATPHGLAAADWKAIRAQYLERVLRVRPVKGGYQARNAGQKWTTAFDGRGFVVTPDPAASTDRSSPAWTWGLELRGYGWGNNVSAVKTPEVGAEGGRITYRWDDRLREWFVNDERGLEHGFTLQARPHAPEGDTGRDSLRFELAVRGSLKPRIDENGTDVAFVDTHGKLVLHYGGLKVTDADGRVLPSHFASAGDVLELRIDDAAARYPVTIDPIAQQAYLKASNTSEDANFGIAVAISGDTVVVGSSGEASNATGVDGDESDTSAPLAGAAYVFVRNADTWTQQAYLKASNTEAGDRFGCSVAISGDTIVVGAEHEASDATGVDGDDSNNDAPDSGAAYVFVRFFGSWFQEAYLKASDTQSGDLFGHAVAVSDLTIAVGAVGRGFDSMSGSGAGGAFVFVLDGGGWTEQANLQPTGNFSLLPDFGASVAVADDTVVVGAPREWPGGVENAGAAFVFLRETGIWNQQAYLQASNAETDDVFGTAVGVSRDTIVVGAPGESSSATGVNGDSLNNDANSSGAAYVFSRTGTNWTQEAYLKASNTGPSDSFGSEVAISEDTIVVGAGGEDSNATGVDGDGGNDDAAGSGAAYVFARSGGVWMQVAFLKASNAEASDGFADSAGGSVAVSADSVLVGARTEASNATGVNGDQSDNSLVSGAAYVFQRSPTWHNTVLTANANLHPANNCGVAHNKWLLYYYRSYDDHIWGAFWAGSTWAQAQLSSTANFTGDMLAFHPANSAVYYEGDNQLWALFYNGSFWQQLQLTTIPNVASDLVIDTSWNIVHYRGTDDRIWAAFWDGTQWQQQSLGGDPNVFGELAVDPVWHTIFYRGFDDHLWVYYYDGANWFQTQISTIPNVVCSMATDGAGLVYYKSDDDTRWACFWDGNAWQQVHLLPTVSIGEETRTHSHFLPIYLGNDGRCHYHYLNGQTWLDGTLGGGGWGLFSGLALTAHNGFPFGLVFAGRDDGNLVVFYYR